MEKAKLILRGKEYELPVLEGTEHEVAVDISSLRKNSGVITLDNGYVNTGCTKSSVCFIDGEKGILRYRGYSIEELCEKSRFIEVAYLLIYGELPTVDELAKFEYNIRQHSMIHEEFKRYYDVWPNTAHPMALLASAISGISTFYPESLDPRNPEHVDLSIIRLMAKIPTFVAYAYKKSIGQPVVYPLNKLSYTANFLNMMFSVPTEEYTARPAVEKALNQLLILHADHEQNCSTAAVRLVGSSLTNIYASMTGGILALSGHLHGGANQAVIEMLNHILVDKGNIKKYIDKAKDPNSNFRLMGFGHRVYKNFDPRATIIKQTCHQLLQDLNIKDPLLDIALELEQLTLQDSYFKEKKLYPNVDFYSGIIYKAVQLPVNMFTVLFAMGRLPGWIAHWKEMTESADAKLGRPRQLYMGAQERSFAPIQER